MSRHIHHEPGALRIAGRQDLLDDALRAARLAGARAEKALRVAENLEGRARTGRAPAAPLLGEAHRLRVAAATHHEDVERHLDTARWLRSPDRSHVPM